MQKVFSFLFGEVVRPLVIVACVVVLGIEASMHNQVSSVLYTLDIVFVVYFLFEMLYRAFATSDWKAPVSAPKNPTGRKYKIINFNPVYGKVKIYRESDDKGSQGVFGGVCV